MQEINHRIRIFIDILIILASALSGFFLFEQFFLGAFLACLTLLILHNFQLNKLQKFIRSNTEKSKLNMPDMPDISPYYELARGFQKQAQRREVFTQVIKKNTHFKEAFKKYPDAVILLRDDNSILWSNITARRMLGVHAKLDKDKLLLNLMPEPKLVELLSQQPERKSTLSTVIDAPKKTDQYLSVVILPLKKSQKMLIFSDISEQINTQIMRQDFVANASHELRTPLTAISGYLESMIDNTDMLVEQGTEQMPIIVIQRPLKTMFVQSQRMTNLINDLLLLSKVEGDDKASLTVVPIDVGLLIKQLIVDAERLSGESGHHIDSEVSENRLLLGNMTMMQALISNLLFNAVNHTKAGTNITIRWEPTKSKGARLIVADNGEGIPAHHLPRITERFYRVNKARTRENKANEANESGTGLGLAIVRHAAVNLDGEIKVESELGVGTRFSCTWSKLSLTKSQQ
jgi:two-component system phosphate regulon sensor histidine kinase PhoR